ncbi:MarR family winged helix-turn-helix transcriptional regulator [Microlunatus soli]|uniref:DNA-binding transcriptional regulator, MarR family n=1 Tax=Microlunatus soli TaxID=630515 RepID=A0A1H1XKN9_9ACTN|nr:MarR family transcriptional regulator [Microlunatus soli]SDT09817.1 DNA-binding transcriptional regulator, MarR family [Microlunatus soli]
MAERSNDAGDDAQDHIAYQTRRLQQVLRRTGDAALQTTGLTLAQYTVLQAIARTPDVSSAQIARDCNVSRQSLQELMRVLRSSGYVRVVEQSGKGRALPIRITPEGRKVLRKADRAVGRVEDRMIAGISEAEVARVVELLRRCARNVEAI